MTTIFQRAKGAVRRANSWATFIVTIGSMLVAGSAVAKPNYAKAMRAIAQDIAALAPDFPQLKEFSAADQDVESLRISYTYHVHPSTVGGRWMTAAPPPEDDGIWFTISFHDQDSKSQIGTQPMMPTGAGVCFGGKRVTFLILEGNKTKRVADRLWSILRRHGVEDC